MAGKFLNKYRIESSRLPNYDYGQEGFYYVTICTKNRGCHFGKISDGKMELSDVGIIIKNEWERTSQIRINVFLDEYIIMPNHIHGIIMIGVNKPIVETHCDASLRRQRQTGHENQFKYQNEFGPQSQNLAAIVRGFKGTSAKQIHIAGYQDFAWQPRFHDHVIRNEDELNRIRKYIMDNPVNWEADSQYE